MKKRNYIYILILALFTLIFIWVIINIVNGYNIKISFIRKYEEMNELSNASNDLSNQDILWQILLTPSFILITYYLIPYILFVISFIRNKKRIIKENIKAHKKMYLSIIFITLLLISYIYYQMITNIVALFELFEYINFFIPLGFTLYIILYLCAYLLGKHFAFSIKLLLKER